MKLKTVEAIASQKEKSTMINILPNWAKRFIRDERAAEVTEVGLYLAIIVAGCVVLMAAIGPSIVGSWQDVATALGV